MLDPVQKKIKIAKQTLLAKQKCELSEALSFATQPVVPTQPAVPTQSTVVSSMVQPKKQHRIGGDRLKGPQICPCCNCLEKSQTVLNIHIDQQHPDYMFPCTICGKLYMSYNSRYKHQIEHTAPTFFCEECSEGFHFQAEQTKHMNVHSAIKPFGCDLCQKWFTQRRALPDIWRCMKTGQLHVLCATKPVQLRNNFTLITEVHMEKAMTPPAGNITSGQHIVLTIRRPVPNAKTIENWKRSRKGFPCPSRRRTKTVLQWNKNYEMSDFSWTVLFVCFANVLCNKCFQCLCTVLKEYWRTVFCNLYFVIFLKRALQLSVSSVYALYQADCLQVSSFKFNVLCN